MRLINGDGASVHECELNLSARLSVTKKFVRRITVGELVAEELEAEANRMPPSYKDQADILRRSAAFMRREGSKKLARVLEVTAQVP